MSMDASGTIGGMLTYGKWKGRNTVRTRVTPHNPKSAAQTAIRSLMAGLVSLYQANKATIDTNFLTLATQRSISKFNAFTSYGMNRHSAALFPSIDIDPTNAAPAANATSLAATPSGAYAELAWSDSVSADSWANYIYRKLGSDPTGLPSELVAVVPNGVEVWQDGPLAAGTWHYVIAAISNHGGAYAVSASDTAVIA